MQHFSFRRICAFIRVGLLLLALPTSVLAQTCTVSMPAIVFGSVDVLAGSAVDTTSTITITCAGGTGAGQRVCVSMGAGSANDATSRQMTGSGGNKARFDLYSDAARTTLWGSWQTGYDLAGVQLDVARDSVTNVTVYARFLGAQPTVVPGAYSSSFTTPFIDYRNKGGAGNCPLGSSTSSTTTSATATVTSGCYVSATNLSFGTLGVLAGNHDAAGSVSVRCSSNLPYTVSLDGGTSGATNPTQRKMTSAGKNIVYGLYRDAARSLPWGATAGVDTASGTGAGVSQILTVYGRIAAQTTPAPGTYSDTVIVTLGY